MRITHYQSGEAPRPRVAGAPRQSFGRIAAQRPAPSSAILLSGVRPTAGNGAALLAQPLESAARQHRGRLVGEALIAAWQRVAAGARAAVATWQRRRERRATYLALRGLDDRTLHDLGFSRSEILSVALDIERDDETRRLRTTRAANAFRLF